MSTAALITILVATAVVLVGVAVAVRLVGRGAAPGGRGLRRRFGPEYDTAVARHDGDDKAAEKELHERWRRHKDVRICPLPAAVREQYAARWTGVQEEFVDAPARAVADADLLLGTIAHERGFPTGSWDELIDALSVHHPRTVHGIREVHAASARVRVERVPTEELREALVGARDLFEDLVRAHPEDQPPQRHARRTGPRPEKPVTRTAGPRHAHDGVPDR
ncbi:hypothetical protein BLA24_04830 [Streptomyces cinnamoneus]|uniref:Secreted protein n=1 Tax=Streptomyces cinnamoneus TaxID=53446 RepID=A0A2G1XNS5_STRCJ|nr:hypothetical protein [Streptomyces cinnamoneus]PHQ52892.1 hypothetical protein BLA24_04830 [Streptomyces cinnamoneus]PPT11449.1 hypothetical protein CYQ11_28700 [Streptomyces cinnamoneus]